MTLFFNFLKKNVFKIGIRKCQNGELVFGHLWFLRMSYDKTKMFLIYSTQDLVLNFNFSFNKKFFLVASIRG